MLKVGTVKPGVLQQVFLAQPFCGASGGDPHPGIPVHAAAGLPQLTQAEWLQVGADKLLPTFFESRCTAPAACGLDLIE